MLSDLKSTIHGLVVLGYRVTIPVPGGDPHISEVDIGLVAKDRDGEDIPAGRVTINGPWPPEVYENLSAFVLKLEQIVAAESGFFTGAIPNSAIDQEVENILASGPWTEKE